MCVEAVLPVSAEKGGKFCFRLELENVGYAAPYKAKTLNIMLRDKTRSVDNSLNRDEFVKEISKWYDWENIIASVKTQETFSSDQNKVVYVKTDICFKTA